MGQSPIQIGTAKDKTVAKLAPMIADNSDKGIPLKFDRDKPEGDGGRPGNFDKAKLVLVQDVITPLKTRPEQTIDWADQKIRNKKVTLKDHQLNGSQGSK
jgi:hypothetical protein